MSQEPNSRSFATCAQIKPLNHARDENAAQPQYCKLIIFEVSARQSDAVFKS